MRPLGAATISKSETCSAARSRGPRYAAALRSMVSGTFPYQSWDVQLQKDFPIGPARVGVVVGVFNLTNHTNIDPGSIDGFIPKTGTNQNFGTGNALLTPPRRLQVGATVGF